MTVEIIQNRKNNDLRYNSRDVDVQCESIMR